MERSDLNLRQARDAENKRNGSSLSRGPNTKDGRWYDRARIGQSEDQIQEEERKEEKEKEEKQKAQKDQSAWLERH